MKWKPTGALLLLSAILISGCVNEELKPPSSICGIKMSTAALTSLLPKEGEKTEARKVKSNIAPNACSVYVDGTFYFVAFHDPERPGFDFSAKDYSPVQPRTFKGKLGVGPLKAEAAATCDGNAPPIYGRITLGLDEMEKLYANSSDELEKFMNAYMPALQKHYGCKD